MSQISLRTRRAAVASAALALCAWQAPAQAQTPTSPWYLGVSQRLDYHSNVYQTSNNKVSDTVSLTSLIAGLDQPIGRQRLHGSLSAGANRYQDRSTLDHDSYTGRLGLDWQTVGNVSGAIEIDASRSLADFSPAGLGSTSSQNLVRTHGGRAVARIGVVTRFSAEVGAATRSTRYSNPLYYLRNVELDEFFGGVRYRPGGSTVFGVSLRRTQGLYPNYRPAAVGVNAAEGFDRDSVDFTVNWQASGASTVDARISYGRDSYDTASTRNFSGLNGEITWRWQPTGKTAVTAQFLRRSGDETSVAQIPGQLPIALAVNRVSNTVAVAADYELTGKIKVRGSLAYSDSTAIDALNASSDEKLTTLTLGVVWDVSRAIRTGCDMTYRNRPSQGFVTGYDATVFGCYGQFVLR